MLHIKNYRELERVRLNILLRSRYYPTAFIFSWVKIIHSLHFERQTSKTAKPSMGKCINTSYKCETTLKQVTYHSRGEICLFMCQLVAKHQPYSFTCVHKCYNSADDVLFAKKTCCSSALCVCVCFKQGPATRYTFLHYTCKYRLH